MIINKRSGGGGGLGLETAEELDTIISAAPTAASKMVWDPQTQRIAFPDTENAKWHVTKSLPEIVRQRVGAPSSNAESYPVYADGDAALVLRRDDDLGSTTLTIINNRYGEKTVIPAFNITFDQSENPVDVEVLMPNGLRYSALQNGNSDLTKRLPGGQRVPFATQGIAGIGAQGHMPFEEGVYYA